MTTIRPHARLVAAVLAGCSAVSSVHAASPAGAAAAPVQPYGWIQGKLAEGSVYDEIWSVPTVYFDNSNPLLQEFAIQGQLQAQAAYGSDDSGNFSSHDRPEWSNWGDVELRRFRLGARARLFNQVKFHSLCDLFPDLEPRVYRRIAETYCTWTPQEAFSLSAGKVELKFTREQEIGSRDLLTFERSQIINQMFGGELTGAWMAGKNLAGGWLYEAGIYGNDWKDEFSDFNGGRMILTKIGYNYTKAAGMDNAQWELHYLHNTEPGYRDGNNPASPNYSDCLALSNEITNGRFSLTAEGFWGDGVNGQQDIYGLTLMPTWKFTDRLQWINTIELAASTGNDGIILPQRYERYSKLTNGKYTGDKGDAYCSAFSGLDYFFYGHKLKLMGGVKYSVLSGGPNGGEFNGWTLLTGLRMMF